MKEVIIAGVFTIIGGVIGGVATYITAVKITREQQFERAAEAFREKIYEVNKDLYPVDQAWTTAAIDNLKMRFPEVKRAVYRFRPFVTEKERFGEACSEYEVFVKNFSYSKITKEFYEELHNGNLPRLRDDYEKLLDDLINFSFPRTEGAITKEIKEIACRLGWIKSKFRQIKIVFLNFCKK